MTNHPSPSEALRCEVIWIDAGRDEPPENGCWKCTCGKTFAPDGVDEYAKHLTDPASKPDRQRLNDEYIRGYRAALAMLDGIVAIERSALAARSSEPPASPATQPTESGAPASPDEPSTAAGERLYLHIASPDEYGWPTDEQLRAAIAQVEREARAASLGASASVPPPGSHYSIPHRCPEDCPPLSAYAAETPELKP